MGDFPKHELERVRELPDQRHPVVRYLAGLGPGSRRTMAEALEKIARLVSDGSCDARSLPWHALRIEHTRKLRDQLAASLAPATANKHLSALRGVLAKARALGLMTADEQRAATRFATVRGPARRPLRRLSTEEWHRLVGACERDPSPAGARDAALFALLFGARLRRSEVVAIEVDDYDPRSGTMRRRPPRPPLVANREARLALDAWIARRGTAPGPLFNPVNKGGRIELRSMSEQAIYIACRKRSREAGLAPVRPEDLRLSGRAGRGAIPPAP